MSLQYAILGLIDRYTLSGYDIMKIFDHGLKHYWSTEHTQIYRMLAKLYEKKLIDYEIEYQESKPDKKVYRITNLGKESFRLWLIKPSELPEIRHSQLLQFSFMAEMETKNIIGFLKDYESLILKKLETYNNPEHIKKSYSIARNKKEKVLWKLVLENGIQYYNNEIDWIHKSIECLEELEEA